MMNECSTDNTIYMYFNCMFSKSIICNCMCGALTSEGLYKVHYGNIHGAVSVTKFVTCINR